MMKSQSRLQFLLYILRVNYLINYMIQANIPSSRFEQYTQIIRNNEVVGFKLDDNDFEFLFDKYGGWFDEQGKYFSAEAIQCNPDQQSSDGQRQPEQKPKDQKSNLNSEMMSLQIKDQKNHRVETIRNLQQIIQNYPQGKEIKVLMSLQPSQPDQDKFLQDFLGSQLNQKLRVENGCIMNVNTQELADRIVQLQGSRVQTHKDKPTLYIDIQLFNSISVSVGLNKVKLQNKLNQLNYQRNKDYANIDEQQDESGKCQCFLEINKNIQNQLRQHLEFRVENQNVQNN